MEALETELSQEDARELRARRRGQRARTPSARPTCRAPSSRSIRTTATIRALIGGRDWNQSNFNRAMQARRQPGSAFKPFVYTAAMDNGFKPTDIIVDEPVTFPGGNGELVRAAELRPPVPRPGDAALRAAAVDQHSRRSSCCARSACRWWRRYARRMGIKSPIGQNLSLALGTSEVTLLELTSAYAVFAESRHPQRPAVHAQGRGPRGIVLERNTPRPFEVLSEETAATMTSMLQSVMDHGTGYPARARGFTAPAAGKTGTMDDYMDAWFVGFVPSLVCGVWVGYDEKKTIGHGMTGARAALPAWTDIMIGATRGRPVEDFPVPAGTCEPPRVRRDRHAGDRRLPERDERAVQRGLRADRVLHHAPRQAAAATGGAATPHADATPAVTAKPTTRSTAGRRAPEQVAACGAG